MTIIKIIKNSQKKLREQAVNMNSNAQLPHQNHQQQQQLNQKPTTPVSNNSNNNNNSTNGGGHFHEILMDEFKKAHRKMFKNGFVENEYQQRMTDDDTINRNVTSLPALGNNKPVNATGVAATEVSKSEQFQLTNYYALLYARLQPTWENLV